MILYRLQVWNDWSDGRPEWEFSAYDDEVYLHRENAERSIVDHAVHVLERREANINSTISSQVQMKAEHDALVAAGLDPKKFGRPPVTIRGPFDWDSAVDTTLTDEAIGYRVAEIETMD